MIPPAPRRWPALLLGAAGAGTVAVVAGEDPPARTSLEDMDMGYLQRSLLKIYICEREAEINAQRLTAFKVSMDKAAEMARTQLTPATQQQLDEARTREKEISHYLLMEKTNSVQMIHVVDRILGTDARLGGDASKEERAILEKKVELIEVPRGTEVREAGRIIGEALGCPVRVEVVETEINKVFFTMGPTTGDAIIKQFCGSAPYAWHFEKGTLVFRHNNLGAPGSAPPQAPGSLGGGDDDEK